MKWLQLSLARFTALVVAVVAISLGFFTVTCIAACLSLFWLIRWLHETPARG